MRVGILIWPKSFLTSKFVANSSNGPHARRSSGGQGLAESRRS
jgi:hypothetical protein